MSDTRWELDPDALRGKVAVVAGAGRGAGRGIAPGGLVVEVTDGTTQHNVDNYRISVFYDLAKTAVNRLAWSQGHELAPYRCTALSVTPGWLRSEMMLEAFGVDEGTWREVVYPPGFATSESPRFVGRGIAAVAADDDRQSWNQRSVTVGDLARRYGFTDLDGSQPDAWAYIAEVDKHPDADPSRYR